MKTDIQEIEETLRGILKAQVPTLRIRKDEPKVLELCGKKEVMQGKQKVDGYYFASVVPKPKDVRFITSLFTLTLLSFLFLMIYKKH